VPHCVMGGGTGASYFGRLSTDTSPEVASVASSRAIGILRVKFVPEPSGWVMLVAGVGLLGVLYRIRV
jgi:hypothetical protein